MATIAPVLYVTHQLYSGVSTTHMGTVVAARMQNMFDLLDAYVNEVVGDWVFGELNYMVKGMKKDVSDYLKMERAWTADVAKIKLYNDLMILLHVLDRRTNKGDVMGIRWCIWEVNTMLQRRC